MYLKELAARIGAELVNAPSEDIQIIGVAALPQAGPEEVGFITSGAYLAHAGEAKAAAIIVKTKLEGVAAAQLVHSNPYYAFAKTAQLFHGLEKPGEGVSEQAAIEEGVKMGRNVVVMPFAFVGRESDLGDDVVIHSGVSIHRGVTIGKGSVVYSNTVIYDGCQIGSHVIIHAGCVIGSDGFGFAPGEHDIAKIPQVGAVVVEDDVEIGGLTTVDAGTMAPTIIGQGSKIDSHVHIGHNSKVGRHTMVCGMAGMAGSGTVGDWCVVGGGARIGNNVVIADRVRIGGMAGVTKSIGEPGDYMGLPSVPAKEWRKEMVMKRRLPKIEQRLKELEARLKELEKEK